MNNIVLRRILGISHRNAGWFYFGTKPLTYGSGGDNVKSFDQIPGPKPLPIIGNLWRYAPYIGEYNFTYIHKTYEKMNRQYGPLIREKLLGNRDLVHAFQPEDIKAVYEDSDENPTRHTHQALIKYRMERPKQFKSIGVFLSNGAEWFRMREHFAPMFVKEDIQNDFSHVMEDISQELARTIPRELNQKNEVDLLPLLCRWAIETFSAIALDVRLGCLSKGGEQVNKFVKAALDTHKCVYITEISPMYKYFRTPAYRKLEAAQSFVGNFVSEYMSGDKMGPNALITKMLNLEGVDYNDVFVMSQDMFLAGIDTMSNTSAFAFYNLAKNPKAQSRLRDELRKVMPTKTSPLTPMYEDITYHDSVVKETLRINPVAFGNGRILLNDLVLSGYKVPAGTQVILQHQIASKNPKYFPQPDVFLPERWEGRWSQPMYHPIAYAPFGFGLRGCMGKKIAVRQMALLLACVVRNFEISYHYSDIDAACRLVSVPDKPLILRFTPVSN